ncbi:MAG: hypothetical protein K2M55_03735 [Muribaculaceae bacterium]|nr:hypothetical protein [Muribaculaceae bacterium]
MSRLHFFYPQNDLALARDVDHFTAPPAAQRLAMAGQTLPLWFGDEGDTVIDDGINGRWYKQMCDKFDIKVLPFGGWKDDMIAAPWGWSKSCRRPLAERGVPMTAMPSDESLEAIRQLSHRRTSAEIASRLAQKLSFPIAPAAVELHSGDEVTAFVAEAKDAILKLPWSSSGRGIIPVSTADLDSRRQSIEGAIARQGSIMGELRLNKVFDFALLYSMYGGKCRFDGFSVFNTQASGAYSSNLLAGDEVLRSLIEEHVPAEQLDALMDALPPILEDIIGDAYSGPIGMDMLACTGRDFVLAPAVELNLRNTMGHVCRRLFDKHISPSARGKYYIVPAADYPGDDFACSNGRMNSGRLNLAQPGADFAFVAELS